MRLWVGVLEMPFALGLAPGQAAGLFGVVTERATVLNAAAYHARHCFVVLTLGGAARPFTLPGFVGWLVAGCPSSYDLGQMAA